MELVKTTKEAYFLDPFNNFSRGSRTCEIRRDPITGRNARILYFPLKTIPRPDIDEILKKDNGFCPFCPDNIEKITPKFSPEFFSQDRYRVGQAVCFPNAFPYDENGAVTVICDKHYVPIPDITSGMLSDSISCCVDFLKDVREKQSSAVYQSINWNYLPLAGSSIIHPHLQITASTSPTNYYSDVLQTSIAYRQAGKGDLFQCLVDLERDLDERFIAETEHFAWLISFAPAGIFDIMAIFKEKLDPPALKGGRLNELVSGIIKSIMFIDSRDMFSYNMSLFFLPGDPDFTPHMRICPRVSIPPLDTCEINYMKMIHNEPMSTVRPETISGEFNRFWKESGYFDEKKKNGSDPGV